MICSVCGGELNKFEQVKLRAAKLFVCSTCGAWNYHPKPTTDQQIGLHDRPDYACHPYFQTRRVHTKRAFIRCQRIFAEFQNMRPTGDFRGEKVLDVGCGSGEFMQAARDLFGVIPIGIDVSRWAVDEVRKKDLTAYCTTLEDAPKEFCEVPFIVAIDVIEHVVDPGSLVRDVARRLRRGGLAYFETPNAESTIYSLGALISRLLNGKPSSPLERLFPAHHIVYLTRKGIEHLAQQNGLRVAGYFTRALPASDIAVSHLLRLGLSGLQLVDRLLNRRALTCFVLSKA
jgi:2-polyprenyl-3-methyl-5-hydroxy-6-metoxy-1,4-benzoquinol methylase